MRQRELDRSCPVDFLGIPKYLGQVQESGRMGSLELVIVHGRRSEFAIEHLGILDQIRSQAWKSILKIQFIPTQLLLVPTLDPLGLLVSSSAK